MNDVAPMLRSVRAGRQLVSLTARRDVARMSSSAVGTHFKVDLRSNGVALVTLDSPDSKVNVLNKVQGLLRH